MYSGYLRQIAKGKRIAGLRITIKLLWKDVPEMIPYGDKSKVIVNSIRKDTGNKIEG